MELLSERGTLTETALVTLPMMTIFTAMLYTSAMLMSLAGLPVETIATTYKAIVAFNNELPEPNDYKKLFINHTASSATDAIEYTSDKKGADYSDKWHLMFMNQLAGVANLHGLQFGLTSTANGSDQIGPAFLESGKYKWVAVERRLLNKFEMSARVLSPVEWETSTLTKKPVSVP